MPQTPDFRTTLELQAKIVGRRIEALKSEIDDLAAEVLPQEATRTALTKMGKELCDFLDAIAPRFKHITTETLFRTKRKNLFDISVKLAAFIPQLGFLRRSAHERNAYEFYDPLRRIARKLFDDRVDVVLSSEWEASPLARHTGIEIGETKFVFIGLPVTEASNPLIIPLAGHELGHSLWSHIRWLEEELQSHKKELHSLTGEKRAQVEQHIEQAEAPGMRLYHRIIEAVEPHLNGDRFCPHTTEKKICADIPVKNDFYDQIINQVEEVFCDIVGIRMFGASYLYAFHYLLCPGVGTKYNNNYPETGHRYDVMFKVLRKFKGALGEMPPDGPLWWHPVPTNLHADSLALSQTIIDSALPTLIDVVETLFSGKCIEMPRPDDVKPLKSRLALGAPIDAKSGETLQRLILAGWLAHQDHKVFPNDHGLNDRRHAVIGELILKSIELLEIHNLQEEFRKGDDGCC
ncbi:MAG: hypothetical protein HQL42_06700 [Alphaproteobacteria bacterium]|nr:hypothetical protein [Alphaproteobacteria bacterium]